MRMLALNSVNSKLSFDIAMAGDFNLSLTVTSDDLVEKQDGMHSEPSFNLLLRICNLFNKWLFSNHTLSLFLHVMCVCMHTFVHCGITQAREGN